MFNMLGRIIKNVFSKPATRKYPYEKREPFDKARGSIDVDISKCVLCGLCQKKCPSNAITVNRAENTWEIDKYKCIICNACTECCPKKCIISNSFYTSPDNEKSICKRIKEAE